MATLTKLAYDHLRAPGEGLKAFSAELKKLTEKDRADLRADFAKIGLNVD